MTTAFYVPGTSETDTSKIIMSAQLVAGQTATNTDAITTANTNIATNTTNIATNTANIATNTSGIASLVAGPLTSGNVAAKADQTTATSTTLAVTPGRQQFHPSAAKAWGYITQSAGTYTLQTSFNIASISKSSTGVVVVNLTTAMTTANYAVIVNTTGSSSVVQANSNINSASQVTVGIIRSSTEAATDSGFSIVFFGTE